MEFQEFVESAVTGVGIYFAIGALFAIPFLVTGIKRIDPVAADGSRGFRFLILPGVISLWPLLLHKWIRSDGQPGEERNSHRTASRRRNMDEVRALEARLAKGEHTP